MSIGMKRSVVALSVLILMSAAFEASAGPVEEVSQISAARAQALQDGNADAYAAAYADNAVFHSALAPFRIEGREAIRGYFAGLFQQFPKRRILSRQPIIRAYNDDLVIQDTYLMLYFTDAKGENSTYALRLSVVWAKVGGRWQIVDQHGSRLP